MEGNPLLPRTPRVRSYVKTGTYAPKSGPLAGRIFTGKIGTTQAYNAYQKARSQTVFGLSGYSEERRLRAALSKPHPRFGSVFEQEKRNPRFGEPGKLSVSDRERIMKAVAPFWNGKTIDLTDPNTGLTDNSFGGRLDQYLQALGRRTGTEVWHPGATPK